MSKKSTNPVDESKVMLEGVDVQIWSLKDAETYASANASHADFLGARESELKDSSIRNILPEKEADLSIQNNQVVFETKESLRTQEWLENVKGDRVLLEITRKPQIGSDGEIKLVVCHALDVTSQKSLETELHTREEQLDQAMAVKNEGFWDWNLITNETFFDDRYYTMAGYAPNEFPENFSSWKKHVHPEDLEKAKSAIDDYLAGRSKKYDIEFRFKHKNGSWIWINGRGKIVERDENGTPVRMIGTHTELTELKRVEKELRESEAHLKATLASIGDGVITCDRERGISSLNDTAEKLTGWTNAEAAGQPLEKIFHIVNAKTRKPIEDPFSQVLATGTIVGLANHTMLIARDGSEYHIADSCSPIMDASGNITGAVLVFRDISREYKQRELLRKSEEKYRRLYETMLQGVIHQNSDGTIISANPAAEKILGISFQQMQGKSSMDPRWKMIEEDGTSVSGENHPTMIALRTGEKIGPVTKGIFRPDKKSHIWINITAIPLFRAKETEPYEVYATFEDITERKQAEEALKRIEWMLSKPFKSSAEAENTKPGQGYGDLTELNQNGLILNCVGREMLTRITADYLDLLETSSAVYEANGDYAYGIFSSCWCRIMDHASRKLCQTSDNAEALASGRWLCHESCWNQCAKETMARGKPVDIQCPGGIRLYGEPIFANNKVIGAINFGYGDPPKDPDKLKELARTFNVSYDSLRHSSDKYKTRPPYIVEMAKKRLRTSAQTIGLLVENKQSKEELYKTLEELRRTQDKIIEQERQRALSTMASGIAHDFNNDIAIIMGYTEMLQEDKSVRQDDKLFEEYMNYISSAANTAAETVRRMRKFYKPRDESALSEIDINSIVKDAVSITEPRWKREAEAHGKKIIIKTNTTETPPIAGNVSELNDMMTNLIFNAVDAMPKGGTIRIETKKKANQVQLIFSDTGIGMTEKTKLQCLDPFYTTKGTLGSGLGLSVVKGIINRHKGKINIETAPGKGATFTFTFPQATFQEPQIVAPAKAENITNKSLSLLVVEDDEAQRRLLKDLLTREGHQVDIAGEVEEGLRWVLEKEYDIVITDRAMPKMSGDQFAAEVKKKYPEMPIIMLTGFGDMMDAAGEKVDSVDKVISKPCTWEKLRAALQLILS